MPSKRKTNSKFNLDYFLKAKNIVPMVLIVIIVFFVFNLLQNKSFNPLFEGMDGSFNEIATEISGNITNLENEIKAHNTSKSGTHDHTDLNATLSNLSTKISELSQHEKLSKPHTQS